MSGENPGLIWLDDPTAARHVSAKARASEITDEEGENLKRFSRDGYFCVQLDLSAKETAQIDADVDRLWNERPANISFAYDSPPMRFTEAVAREQRRPRHRIHDLHSASEVARRLYLHPLLHRYASLILGETAVATQSLYFEYGSQQALHRDSTVVPTPRFGGLLAAWIALEDIATESGPLMYVPGSQRFPFFAFAPGRYVYDPTADTSAGVETAMAFYNAELENSGLPVRQFIARRGEVLVWHSALMHGGASPANEWRTRKSFVVHYSALHDQRSRQSAVREIVGGAAGESVFSTSEVWQQNGAHGFANALDGEFLYRR